jgi:hypothetical protein
MVTGVDRVRLMPEHLVAIRAKDARDEEGCCTMRTIRACALAGALALSACSATGAPTQSRSHDPAPATSAATGASTAPSAPTADELQLLSRVRLDLQSRCVPLRTDLVAHAVAAVECAPVSDVANRATLSLFDSQADLMATYEALMAAHDVPMRTNGGRCLPDTPSEGGYVPGDGHPGVVVVERGGCYLDTSGNARYLATMPPFVLVEVEGKVADMAAVEHWAWLGNQDQPGAPTVWRESGPASPEK